MPSYKNLVFKGGGVRGIAYLGALKYFYENGLMRSVERVAGTSAGAITATVLALNFPDFDSIKDISDSLDYRKIPAEGDPDADQKKLATANPRALKKLSLGIFGNLQCSLRLIQGKRLVFERIPVYLGKIAHSEAIRRAKGSVHVQGISGNPPFMSAAGHSSTFS